jgi:hypothetical protein
MKSLGMDLGEPDISSKPNSGMSALGGRPAQPPSAGGSVPLARGTKRLGMGRAPSSWGAKKAKQ